MSITPLAAPSLLHQLVHQDPTFGYDPWLNASPSPPPFASSATAGASAAAAEYSGEDTIGQDISLLTPGQAMYASYVPPSIYAGWDQLVAWAKAHAPHAFLLSITIAGSRARCADVEPGAMATSDFAHWYDTEAIHDAFGVPWGYTSASNMQALIDAAAGRRFVRFSAHYGRPHICAPGTCGWPQADWTQWADAGPQSQNFDRSVGRLLPAPVKPPDTPSGTARVVISHDLKAETWGHSDLPGVVHWGDVEEWDCVLVKVGRGGKIAGSWQTIPLPRNFEPPK